MLENNALHWVLDETAALFSHASQPYFVVSLGLGEVGLSKYNISNSGCRSFHKTARCTAFAICPPKRRATGACKSLVLASKVLRHIHQLKDISVVPSPTLKSQADPALAPKNDFVARRTVASFL